MSPFEQIPMHDDPVRLSGKTVRSATQSLPDASGAMFIGLELNGTRDQMAHDLADIASSLHFEVAREVIAGIDRQTDVELLTRRFLDLCAEAVQRMPMEERRKWLDRIRS